MMVAAEIRKPPFSGRRNVSYPLGSLAKHLLGETLCRALREERIQLHASADFDSAYLRRRSFVA
jgi:hypothetical protein